MPHRNFITIVLVAVFSMACYSRIVPGHYAAKLQQIMNHIHDDGLYPTDRRVMFEAAAHAMAHSVGDENTAFEPKAEKKAINKQLSQEFGGIGAALDTVNHRPYIAHVLLDGPAAKAGLRPGDLVLSVDGKDTLKFKNTVERSALSEFVDTVTGEIGTPVTLVVEREGTAAPLTFSVTRENVFVESIKGYVRGTDGVWDYSIPDSPNIAYLRISGGFGAKTYNELVEALAAIHQQGYAGLVIDLRGNSGGLLPAAENICNLFLPADKVIVTTRDRNKEIVEEYKSDGSGPYQDIPLAIIINKRSASASEIVAGCLKDLGRAVVVGERSFGKGTVQKLFDVDGGRSMLRLSTANWCTASERKIHRTKTNGGSDREKADESFEWGILPSQGYEVVIDNKQLDRLSRHFNQLAWDAIDAVYALPKPEPGPAEATPETAAKKPAAADKKSAENEPFTDVQLEKAVEAVEKLINQSSNRRAA